MQFVDFRDYDMFASRVQFRIKGTVPDKKRTYEESSGNGRSTKQQLPFSLAGEWRNRPAKMFWLARCHDFSPTVTIGLPKKRS